jgi:uncharacterized metal-binding protein YceD (DUF177 family)
MTDTSIGPPPFSRPFVVDEWRTDEVTVAITADARERAALAAAFGIPAIAALTVEFTLERAGRDRIDVHGRIDATVTRICVVSLDPFEMDVSEPVDVTFAPEAELRAAEAHVAADQDVSSPGPGEEPPDPIVEGRIDLGALAAEFLALGLDPYPRKPGVDFAAPADASAPASPFAVLGRLKGRERAPDE